MCVFINSSVNSQGVMDLNMLSPGRNRGGGGAGAVEGGKPRIKTHLAAMKQKPGMAADLRELRFLFQEAEMEVPVWAVISGVIPFLHSCCKATKCPRCEEVIPSSYEAAIMSFLLLTMDLCDIQLAIKHGLVIQ